MGPFTMKALKFSAILLASTVALPAVAQDTLTSGSASGAEANSGSVSGASSDNHNAQGQNQTANNAGIGNSTSESTSGSASYSGSVSGAESNGNQQGQSQGNTNTVGQLASNQQGVSVSNTFNSTNHKRSYVGTNTAVPLAASSSFSSDYCGGTASGGASVAPIGLSIGGASPVFDDTCRYIRLAQTGGMMAANWHNMGELDMRNRMMTFATWATCMAGPQADKRRKGHNENVVMEACLRLGLLGSEGSPVPPPPAPQAAIQQDNGQPTPEAVERYKTPRGELEYQSNPVVQPVPMAALVH